MNTKITAIFILHTSKIKKLTLQFKGTASQRGELNAAFCNTSKINQKTFKGHLSEKKENGTP